MSREVRNTMERVSVALRVRPLLPAERDSGEVVNITALPEGNRVQVVTRMSRATQNQVYKFDLDYCLGPSVAQENVFRELGIAELCDAAFEGKAATVMCFGQTGSGKTYTMSGASDGKTGFTAEDGIQFTAAQYIAMMRDRLVTADGNTSKTVTLRASYVELFNERINDLLAGTEGLKCRWSREANSFFVQDLMVVECLNADDILLVLREGQLRRKRAEHLLNADSSRSHLLFTLYMEVVECDRPARRGKITFVDLAGSERLRDTGTHGDENKSINRSLFVLGNVIECLSKARPSNQRDHIPYRSSVLTQLLMDSLDGGCHTLMVACVTPSARFVEESLRTIHFAQRTRNIRSRPVERVDPAEQELYDLKMEVRRLREENALLRCALKLPESGPIDPSMLHRVGQNLSTPVPTLGGALPVCTTTAAAATRFSDGGIHPPPKHLTISEGTSSGCRSDVSVPKPTALDILSQLPNSSSLLMRQCPLPSGKSVPPPQFGFQLISKKNKFSGA